MSDRTAFMKAICNEPTDDTARLVFADWLDERGDRGSDDRDLAEFIRTQCGRPHPDPHYPGCWFSYHQHRTIDKRLGWVADVNRVLRDMGEGGLDQKNFGCYEWNDAVDGTVYMKIADTEFVLRRGFVEHVVCTSGAWVDYADRLTAWPVAKATFTSWPIGNEFSYVHGSDWVTDPRERNRTHNLIPFKERWPRIEFEFAETVNGHNHIKGLVSPDMCYDGKGGRVPR